MIEEKYLELINRDIDHVISPKQDKKLKKYLERNPDAQKLYDDLVVMSKKLSKVSIVEPPKNLRQNIVNALPVEQYSKHERRTPFKRYLAAFLFGNKPRYAYVFSAGLMLGIMVISLSFIILSKNSSVNIHDLYGTIGTNPVAKGLHIADELAIDENDVVGNLRFSYSDDEIFIDATIGTREAVRVMLTFDESDMSFREFKKTSNTGNDLTVKGSSIEFNSNGMNHYLITLGRRTSTISPVNLKIYSGAGIAYEYTLLKSHGGR